MGKVKKLVAAAMVSVMSLSVVGCNMIEQTAESKAKTVLAKVGDTNITLGDVDSELKADIDNLKQTYGQDYESSIPESLKEQLKTVRTQVLNQLVNEQIMSQKAKALNLIPSDEELESKIDLGLPNIDDSSDSYDVELEEEKEEFEDNDLDNLEFDESSIEEGDE